MIGNNNRIGPNIYRCLRINSIKIPLMINLTSPLFMDLLYIIP